MPDIEKYCKVLRTKLNKCRLYLITTMGTNSCNEKFNAVNGIWNMMVEKF